MLSSMSSMFGLLLCSLVPGSLSVTCAGEVEVGVNPDHTGAPENHFLVPFVRRVPKGSPFETPPMLWVGQCSSCNKVMS